MLNPGKWSLCSFQKQSKQKGSGFGLHIAASFSPKPPGPEARLQEQETGFSRGGAWNLLKLDQLKHYALAAMIVLGPLDQGIVWLVHLLCGVASLESNSFQA